MYLFSTFNNNTNFMLNKKNEYRNMVNNAENELNIELDNIKKGKINLKSDDNCIENRKISSDDVVLRKSVDIIDNARGVYMVTVYASSGERKVRLEGYEQYRNGENIVQN